MYLQVTGPQYETPAEVLAARHMGMRVCAINCISNMAAGMEEAGFSEDTVEETVKGASKNFQTLVTGLLDTLNGSA